MAPFRFFCKIDAASVLTPKFQPYSDEANYIQHRILVGRQNWQTTAYGFTRLKTAYLRLIVNRRILKTLLKEMEGVGLIERDRYYVVGEKSYGYKIGRRYRSAPTTRIICRHKKISQRIRNLYLQQQARQDQKSAVYAHLRSWLPRVSLNKELAQKAVARMEVDTSKMTEEELRDLYWDQVMSILDPEEIEFTVCDYGRVHTLITRLVKGIRQLLNIDGEPLVAIDVANSQPLFLLAALMAEEGVGMLSKATEMVTQPTASADKYGTTTTADSSPVIVGDWSVTEPRLEYSSPAAPCSDSSKRRLVSDDRCLVGVSRYPASDGRHMVPFGRCLVSDGTTQVSDGWCLVNRSTPPTINHCTIPLSNSRQTLGTVPDRQGSYQQHPQPPTYTGRILQSDLSLFIHLCETGRLYQHLMNRMDWTAGKAAFKSEELFRVLYGTNGPWDKEGKHNPSKLAKVWQADFPTVWQFIRKWKKKHGYKDLAREMQRRESDLMILQVCGRLMREHPACPVVTIHDSILTTPRWVETVHRIMLEEFAKLSLHPTLHVEAGNSQDPRLLPTKAMS